MSNMVNMVNDFFVKKAPNSMYFRSSDFVNQLMVNILLKEYSVIQTTSFLWHDSEDIQKKASKISVDSNLCLRSYAWLCALALLHRLLC